MTKEELLTSVRPKLGQTNLSERTLDEFANSVATAMGADYVLTDDFANGQVTILQSMAGQMSHDIAQGIEDWKKNNPAAKPDNEKNATTAANIQNQNAESSANEAILKELRDLKTRLDNNEKAERVTAFKHEVEAKLKQKGAANEYILSNVVNNYKFDISQPVESVASDIEKLYNSEYKKCFGSAAHPKTPTGGEPKTDAQQKSRRDAQKARMISRGLLKKSDNADNKA